MDDFQAQIDAFIQATGMTATALGKGAVNDTRFVHDLRKGRSCTFKTANRVLKFMQEYLKTKKETDAAQGREAS